MRLSPTELPDVFTVDVTAHKDERGLFARIYDEAVFKAAGLPHRWPQSSLSFNRLRGTLRGLHYQAEPKGEPKIVRCTRGRIFDVAVDLRPQSPAYRRWTGLELTAENRRALYVPPGCAHGFITLEDECEVAYQIGEDYTPELARGVRWNDPAFAIVWPIEPLLMSDRDAGYGDFQP
jgi:dTDP-4-dehydrorhamnose 3,5-epimerase